MIGPRGGNAPNGSISQQNRTAKPVHLGGTHRMKYLILSLVGLLTSGCAAVLVASTAVVLTEEFQDNAITVTMEQDADLVWASAKASLAHMTEDMIHTDEDLKSAVTKIDGAEVSVAVQNWNTGETRVRVMAKKYLVYRHELANRVCDIIAKDLKHEPSH
jgi:hypothetical protein